MGCEPLGPDDDYSSCNGKTIKKISNHRGEFLLRFKDESILRLEIVNIDGYSIITDSMIFEEELDAEGKWYLDLISDNEYNKLKREEQEKYNKEKEEEEKEYMYRLMEKYNVQSSAANQTGKRNQKPKTRQ